MHKYTNRVDSCHTVCRTGSGYSPKVVAVLPPFANVHTLNKARKSKQKTKIYIKTYIDIGLFHIICISEPSLRLFPNVVDNMLLQKFSWFVF